MSARYLSLQCRTLTELRAREQPCCYYYEISDGWVAVCTLRIQQVGVWLMWVSMVLPSFVQLCASSPSRPYPITPHYPTFPISTIHGILSVRDPAVPVRANFANFLEDIIWSPRTRTHSKATSPILLLLQPILSPVLFLNIRPNSCKRRETRGAAASIRGAGEGSMGRVADRTRLEAAVQSRLPTYFSIACVLSGIFHGFACKRKGWPRF
jgi:hypothetical protein